MPAPMRWAARPTSIIIEALHAAAVGTGSGGTDTTA